MNRKSNRGDSVWFGLVSCWSVWFGFVPVRSVRFIRLRCVFLGFGLNRTEIENQPKTEPTIYTQTDSFSHKQIEILHLNN